MKWNTKISKLEEKGVRIRGYALMDLLGKVSFSDMVCLLLKGELPAKGEREVIDAILVSAAEHGVQVPSVTAARIVQSSGNPLNASVAAGVLAIGDFHGGAVEGAAKLFYEKSGEKAENVVKEILGRKERVPGYGHKHYITDPRVEFLFSLMDKHKLSGKYIKFAKEVDLELCKQSGKVLHLNIDGAIAAIILDLGFSWQSAKSFFIIPRVAGICAHAVEERINEPPYRRVLDEDINYSGPDERKL